MRYLLAKFVRWKNQFAKSRKSAIRRRRRRETDLPIAIILFVVCALLTFMLWWLGQYDKPLESLWPEMGGMTLDVLFILIVFKCFEERRKERQEIAHHHEVIDDYKRWDEPEALLRIAGAIRRLNRLGEFALDMAGARLSKFDFADQGIEKIDGSTFYNGQWGEQFGDSAVRMVEVDFDRISCRNVSFSLFNWFAGSGTSGSNSARFVDCSFNETDLSQSTFDGAELTWTEPPPEENGCAEDMGDGQWCWDQTHYGPFDLANLKQVSFKGCYFKNADFRNAENILEADFTGAKGLENAFFNNDKIRAAVLVQSV